LALPLAFTIVALGGPGTAQAAGEHTLASGQLEAVVDADPFRLQFRDRSSGRVLSTLGGGLPSPTDPRGRYGPLGYSFDLRIPVINNAFLGYYTAAEAETIWFHATEVLGAGADGAGLVLDLATNDPLGHRLAVRLTPTREGAITVDSRIAPGSGPLAEMASVSGAAFAADADERFLGFGERSNAVDQTGNDVFNWAEEGPFSSGSAEDLLRPLVPDFTFPSGPTATNFPIPWAISTRGFGLLIDQTQRSRFHLADERQDAWQAEVEAPFFRFTVFAGPTPADVLRRYSGYAGRQPDPAPWIFGPWYQPTLESRQFELADRFRAEDVPVTVAQTYTHYLPCGAHVGSRDGQRALTTGYHARGYKITTYFNPHICTDYQPVYDQAAANGWLVENQLGQPYVLSNPFTADQLTSEVDFTAAGAPGFYAGLLDEAIDDGYDGWMEDFGEYTPTDSVFSDGRRGLEMHNRYPVLYHCASYARHGPRYGRDAAVFIRSGWHGVQPCARVVWGGDPTEDWSCSDGLCAAVHQALSTGLSGIAYWGSDIGGFHAVVNPRTDDELNIRWLQFGAFSGVMRTQANGFSFSDNRADRSQVWHPAVMPIWRRFTKLRTQLLPYIEAASEVYQRTALPITRHLALAFPGDPEAIAQQEEYMFGPDLLAAPVIEPGDRQRTLYAPGGQWVDFWRAVSFDPGSGAFGLSGPAQLLAGGRNVTLPAPIDELPLLIRAGTVLPLLPADVDTLAPEGSGAGLVHLGERRDALRLLAFPHGTSESALAGGESIRSSESSTTKKRKKGRKRGKAGSSKKRKRRTTKRWTLDIDGAVARNYELQASLSTLSTPFTPCLVKLDGKRVLREGAKRPKRKKARKKLAKGSWDYDPASSILTAAFQGTDRSLVASSRCRRKGKGKNKDN
jgi:alpha-glucosidase (family GH31 glycosyl hydrolase)